MESIHSRKKNLSLVFPEKSGLVLFLCLSFFLSFFAISFFSSFTSYFYRCFLKAEHRWPHVTLYLLMPNMIRDDQNVGKMKQKRLKPTKMNQTCPHPIKLDEIFPKFKTDQNNMSKPTKTKLDQIWGKRLIIRKKSSSTTIDQNYQHETKFYEIWAVKQIKNNLNQELLKTT